MTSSTVERCPHCGARVTVVHVSEETVNAVHADPWCREWKDFIEAKGYGPAPAILTDEDGNYVGPAEEPS